MNNRLNIDIIKLDTCVLLQPSNADEVSTKLVSDWFEPAFWHSNDLVVGQSSGRNTTWFVRPTGQQFDSMTSESDWVLRHYYRGGLVAKVTRDKFLYTGLKKTRPYKELSLLEKMRQLALPVPKTIGARVRRQGIGYTADLLMEKIIANDLVKLLSEGKLCAETWQVIGKTIGKFHQHGIYHADLNSHNIMLDADNKVWLIDFDQCKQQPPASQWWISNLQRLKRSFEKEKTLNQNNSYDEKGWQHLLTGYQQVNPIQVSAL